MTRRNRRGIATVVGLAAAALALTACTQSGGTGAQAVPKKAAADASQAPDNANDNTLDPNGAVDPNSANGETTADSAPTGVKASLAAKTLKKMGQVVVDTKLNKVLYRFDPDKKNESACTGACLVAWPIVESEDVPELSGIDPARVTTFIRKDNGKQQVAIDGHPVYTFAKDTVVNGQPTWKGQANKLKWWVISPDGTRNVTCVPKGVTRPPAEDAPAQPGSNDTGTNNNNSGGDYSY